MGKKLTEKIMHLFSMSEPQQPKKDMRIMTLPAMISMIVTTVISSTPNMAEMKLRSNRIHRDTPSIAHPAACNITYNNRITTGSTGTHPLILEDVWFLQLTGKEFHILGPLHLKKFCHMSQYYILEFLTNVLNRVHVEYLSP